MVLRGLQVFIERIQFHVFVLDLSELRQSKKNPVDDIGS
nr:hypothetical protein [Pseudomonas syringae pv. actinidiae]